MMVESPDTEKKTHYVWGYNNTKIIAIIENYITDYNYANQIQKINDAKIRSNQDAIFSTSSSETNLRNKLSALRAAFPKSQVTSYTYDLLVGVTSITNPRGQAILYEYDDFNRLKQVKDHDGNILNKNAYNYAPQN